MEMGYRRIVSSLIFRRHKKAAELERAKGVLMQAGLAHPETIETELWPRIVWRPGAKKAN